MVQIPHLSSIRPSSPGNGCELTPSDDGRRFKFGQYKRENASGQWLFYANGFADAHIKTASLNPAGGLNVVSETTQWTAGYTVGGGVDYKLTQSWILGADFNYYNFRFTPGFTVSNFGGTATVTNGRNQIYAGTVRLSYLFNLARTGSGY